MNAEQLEILAIVLMFFGGVALWVRHRVQDFDRKHGPRHAPGE